LSGRKAYLERIHPEIAFGGFSEVDVSIAFYTRVHSLLEPSFVALDIGCGRGSHAQDPLPFRRNLLTLRGKCRRVIGIDVSKPSAENPMIDEFRLIEDGQWPVENESVDLCICQNVLEHVEDPAALFAESARVLRDHGLLCIRTPNAWGYAAIAARLIPNRWHASVLKMLGRVADSRDVFPTPYRCNTVSKIKSMMRRHGFEACVFTKAIDPEYLLFSRITSYLEALIQRFSPRIFKPVLFAFGRKTASGSVQATGGEPGHRPSPAPMHWPGMPQHRSEAA
jgi:SAM-dependent methyltransferase